jgi:hypothetical protein
MKPPKAASARPRLANMRKRIIDIT